MGRKKQYSATYDTSTTHLHYQEGRRAETFKNHAYFEYIGNSLLEFMLRSSFSIIGTLIPIIRYLGATSNTPLLEREAGRRGGCECLRFVYNGRGHVYAPFTSHRLYFHQTLVARFTHPETVTHL